MISKREGLEIDLITNAQQFKHAYVINLHKNPNQRILESFQVGEHVEMLRGCYNQRSHGSYTPLPPYLYFILFYVFLGPHLKHMEVARLGGESEL